MFGVHDSESIDLKAVRVIEGRGEDGDNTLGEPPRLAVESCITRSRGIQHA
jgi:hypothetical protein